MWREDWTRQWSEPRAYPRSLGPCWTTLTNPDKDRHKIYCKSNLSKIWLCTFLLRFVNSVDEPETSEDGNRMVSRLVFSHAAFNDSAFWILAALSITEIFIINQKSPKNVTNLDISGTRHCGRLGGVLPGWICSCSRMDCYSVYIFFRRSSSSSSCWTIVLL